jgi:hypothetical protein
MGTPEFEQSSDERKRVEMRFAHLKVHHRFERMRLRGFTGRVTSFTSQPLSRTSRLLQTTSGVRRLACLREVSGVKRESCEQCRHPSMTVMHNQPES